MQVQLLDIAGIRQTSDAFKSALCEVALGLGLNPSYLAAPMAVETGHTFSPSIQNPYTGAVGLIQFMPTTAAALGTSIDALKQMSAVQQLDYVGHFFKPYAGRIRPEVPGDYYLAIFYPALIGHDPSTVIYSAGDTGYAENAGLDRNGDGEITVSDVTATVDGVVADAQTRPPITVNVGSSVFAWTFGTLVAALVGYAAYDRRWEIARHLDAVLK